MKRLTKVLAITSTIILIFAVVLGSTMFTLIYKNAGPIESTAPSLSSDNVFTTETRSPESDTFPNQQETTSVPGTTSTPMTTGTPPTTTAPPPETTSPPETEPPEPTGELAFRLSNDGTYYILWGIGTYTGSEVTVPETYNGLPVREIGSYAFPDNISAKKIIIPGTVKVIRAWAFENLEIETVIFTSEGLEKIEQSAFRFAKKLKNIVLPNSVKSIEGGAFNNCESLEKINIPTSMTVIEGLFYGCKNLKYVEFHDGIKEIDTGAFENTAITSLNLPNGIEKIGMLAFSGCKNLESVVFPKKLKTVGYQVFAGCDKLKSVTINENLLELHPYVLSEIPNLLDIYVDDKNLNYKSVDGVLFDKSGKTLIIYPCGRTDKLYTVPEGTEIIGHDAFVGMDELEKVVLPKSLVRLETQAFAVCRGLKYVEIPETVTYIGWGAFRTCLSLEEIVIPSRVTELGDLAFDSCSALKEIVIPESVTKIGSFAFRDCTSLQIITVKGNAQIGEGAFEGCKGVEIIEFSGEDVYIDPTAFTNMHSLKTFIVSDKNKAYKVVDNVLFSKDEKTLVAYPFGKVGNEYTVPAGVKVIENAVFANNTVLERVTLPDGLEVIEEHAFEYCSNLKYVNLPDSLKTIGICAFSQTALTEAVIPEGIETVEASIFVSTALETITIPKRMKVIMSYLVYDCKNLNTINYGGTVEEWNNIEKQWYWNGGCPEITVICTDGTVTVPANKQ